MLVSRPCSSTVLDYIPTAMLSNVAHESDFASLGGGFPLISSIQPIILPRTSFPTKKTRTRTSIFENPKEVAAEFACAITVPSSNQSDWVARNGNESLFRTLRRIIPEVRNLCTFLKFEQDSTHFEEFVAI